MMPGFMHLTFGVMTKVCHTAELQRPQQPFAHSWALMILACVALPMHPMLLLAGP